MFHNVMIFLVYQLGTMIGLNCIEFSWKILRNMQSYRAMQGELMIIYPIQIRSLDLPDFSAFEVLSKNVHGKIRSLDLCF